MSLRHQSCPSCRIRVAADAEAIAVLDSRCPICAGPLAPPAAAAVVIGCRLFDLSPFSEEDPKPSPRAPSAWPAPLSARDASSLREDLDRLEP